jgi:hypothetical protein
MIEKLTVVTGDDWSGLYVDGEWMAEGHHVEAEDVCRALGISVDFLEAHQEWLDRRGALPSKLHNVITVKDFYDSDEDAE